MMLGKSGEAAAKERGVGRRGRGEKNLPRGHRVREAVERGGRLQKRDDVRGWRRGGGGREAREAAAAARVGMCERESLSVFKGAGVKRRRRRRRERRLVEEGGCAAGV